MGPSPPGATPPAPRPSRWWGRPCALYSTAAPPPRCRGPAPPPGEPTMTPPPDGLLVLDKPAGMTSRAALDRALRWFPRRTRMGHAGTLDPLATGVLVLCVGSATRLVEYVQRMSKTYTTTLRLGARSDSDDADGTITPTAGAIASDLAVIRSLLPEFIGTLNQVPPAYSAAKLSG